MVVLWYQWLVARGRCSLHFHMMCGVVESVSSKSSKQYNFHLQFSMVHYLGRAEKMTGECGRSHFCLAREVKWDFWIWNTFYTTKPWEYLDSSDGYLKDSRLLSKLSTRTTWAPCLVSTFPISSPTPDNLYLDMNGIIHNCTHSFDEEKALLTTIANADMFAKIFTYVENIFNTVKPSKVFYMAIDGIYRQNTTCSWPHRLRAAR